MASKNDDGATGTVTMCAKWIDRTLRSRATTMVLSGIAIIGTVIAAEAALVDQYVPDNERLQTFGGFRDGTYAALIAIVSIVMQFVQSIYRERVNERASIERTNQATIYAEALKACHASAEKSAERIEDALEKWTRDRPCLLHQHREGGHE